MIAADLGAALARDPDLNLRDYFARLSGREHSRVYVVMKDGRVASNSAQPLSTPVRHSIEAALAGINPRRFGGESGIGPVVTAPIQVEGELRGMVVMPPPPPGGMLRDVGRLLSLPGTMLLILATTLAAVVIFGPARRRLRALEEAAERLGSGDLAARAPENGGDEIARVAHAFNQMAAELAVRDEALRTSDRLRRQMLADVSHELKTPLTAMRGYVETLHMPHLPFDAQTRARYLDTIAHETRRLERIVTDLLDLARHENGVGALDVRVFAIELVFSQVLQRYEHDARSRDVTLHATVAPSADQVVGDPERIEQVIDNLVANALRHTPSGGSIELCASAADDVVSLSVTDSGAGIAPEHVSHVFERFYKGDASRAAGSGGSGLGLSIAKAIVERHGGTIEVASTPGRTVFTIRLPHQSVDRRPMATLQSSSAPTNL
jgi:signal transduction histidine kinase